MFSPIQVLKEPEIRPEMNSSSLVTGSSRESDLTRNLTYGNDPDLTGYISAVSRVPTVMKRVSFTALTTIGKISSKEQFIAVLLPELQISSALCLR